MPSVILRRLAPRGATEATWNGRGRRLWHLLSPEELRLLLARRVRALGFLGGALAPELEVVETQAIFTQGVVLSNSVLARGRYRR